jgi:hypothetical protein
MTLKESTARLYDAGLWFDDGINKVIEGNVAELTGGQIGLIVAVVIFVGLHFIPKDR